jgi:hypothetical protein
LYVPSIVITVSNPAMNKAIRERPFFLKSHADKKGISGIKHTTLRTFIR